MTPDSIFITDFRPAAESRAEAIPYRLDGRPGWMLRLPEGLEGPVRLPSPVTGWHEIHLGLMGSSSIQIKLSSDPTFRWIESAVSWDRVPTEGEEAFWKVADLTDESFEFLPQHIY